MAYRGQLEAMKRRREVLREESREQREGLEEREETLRRREKREAAKARRALIGKGEVALQWIAAAGADTLTGAGVGLPIGLALLGGLPGGGLLQVAVGSGVGAMIGLGVGIRRAREALD